MKNSVSNPLNYHLKQDIPAFPLVFNYYLQKTAWFGMMTSRIRDPNRYAEWLSQTEDPALFDRTIDRDQTKFSLKDSAVWVTWFYSTDWLSVSPWRSRSNEQRRESGLPMEKPPLNLHRNGVWKFSREWEKPSDQWVAIFHLNLATPQTRRMLIPPVRSALLGTWSKGFELMVKRLFMH